MEQVYHADMIHVYMRRCGASAIAYFSQQELAVFQHFFLKMTLSQMIPVTLIAAAVRVMT